MSLSPVVFSPMPKSKKEMDKSPKIRKVKDKNQEYSTKEYTDLKDIVTGDDGEDDTN